MLRLDDAVQAVERLCAQGRRIDTWEGWVQFADGGRTHSLQHQGSFVLPATVPAAAQQAIKEMRDAQRRWDRNAEYPGASLYFCIVLIPDHHAPSGGEQGT